MGGFTRPAWALGSLVFPSFADVGLIAALVVFNAVVFVVYFQRWLGEGWAIDCSEPGFDCEDAPVGRAASYLVRVNLALVWFPVCRNVWGLCRRASSGRGLLSYEQQVSLHRWLGYSVLASMTLHLADFWVLWLGQGWDTFMHHAFPSGVEDNRKEPRCELDLQLGMQCFGLCEGGKQDGKGPCGEATTQDCCHTMFQDGLATAWSPSTGAAACVCSLAACGGCPLPGTPAHDARLMAEAEKLELGMYKGEDHGENYDVGLYNFYGELVRPAPTPRFISFISF